MKGNVSVPKSERTKKIAATDSHSEKNNLDSSLLPLSPPLPLPHHPPRRLPPRQRGQREMLTLAESMSPTLLLLLMLLLLRVVVVEGGTATLCFRGEDVVS